MNLVSVTKNTFIALPSGVVETLTFLIIISSTDRTQATSAQQKNKKELVSNCEFDDIFMAYLTR